jgi:hypothetical protein
MAKRGGGTGGRSQRWSTSANTLGNRSWQKVEKIKEVAAEEMKLKDKAQAAQHWCACIGLRGQ